MNWIYLSKNGDDEYIEMMAAGANVSTVALESWDYNSSSNPLVLRGIMKHKIIKQCWQDKRRFRYMDSGYFGNLPGPTNPNGFKHWHRIVENNIQHDNIRPCPADRFEKFKIKLKPRQTSGSCILIVPPDDKPCIFYDIDRETWLQNTIDTIKKYTDRPIRLRDRTASRKARVSNNVVNNLSDVFALVTFNSIAATEAIMAGVPAFALAPANAARPVANVSLDLIDNPMFPDSALIHAWACHLAYGQFHIDELKDGSAVKIMDKMYE